MALKIVKMRATAAGPTGIYFANKFYRVDEKLANEWCAPHKQTGTKYADLVNVLPRNANLEIGPARDTEEDANKNAGEGV